jgi:hypothetical protein
MKARLLKKSSMMPKTVDTQPQSFSLLCENTTINMPDRMVRIEALEQIPCHP